MSRRLLALASIALTGAVSIAQHSITISQPTNFIEDIVVPAYDSSNGPLRSVTLCLRYRHVRTVRCESLDAAPSIVSLSFDIGRVDFFQGSNQLTSLTFGAESSMCNLTPFDNTLDYQVTSACMTSSVNKGDMLVHIDDPAVLAAFIDTGTVTIQADGLDIFSTSGPGNVCTESTTQFNLFAEVIYNN